MRTETIEIYKFDELSDDAKQTAIDNNREFNFHSDWYDYVYDDAKKVAELIGIEISNIWFSGFYSQGDGACFEGSYSYRKNSLRDVKEYAPTDTKLHQIVKELQTAQRKRFYKLSATVKHRGHYYHEFCTDISVTDDGTYYGDVSESVEDEIAEPLRDFMHWIYKRLEAENDYLSSDESIAESLSVNECEFTKEGGEL